MKINLDVISLELVKGLMNREAMDYGACFCKISQMQKILSVHQFQMPNLEL